MESKKPSEKWNSLSDKDKNNIIEQTSISSQWFKSNWDELPEDVKQEFVAYNLTQKAMAKKNKLKSAQLEKDLQDVRDKFKKAIISQDFEKSAYLRQEERKIMELLGMEIPKTEKKHLQKRSFEDLKAKGNKGIIIMEAQRAFALAEQDNYKDLDINKRNANGILFTLTKDGGIIDNMPEDSTEFESLVELGRLIKEDLSNNKLTEPIRDFIRGLAATVPKSKLKQTADKKSISEQVAEEEKAKAQLDVEGAFVEDRDKYIALGEKGNFKLAVAEIQDYGHKQPFGHLRKLGDTCIFYYSEKLETLLDKHNIQHTILESKDELLEYISKL